MKSVFRKSNSLPFAAAGAGSLTEPLPDLPYVLTLRQRIRTCELFPAADPCSEGCPENGRIFVLRPIRPLPLTSVNYLPDQA